MTAPKDLEDEMSEPATRTGKTPEQYADENLIHRTTYTTEDELRAKNRARLTAAFAACQSARDEEIAELRATLYKLVQVASARDDWKQSTWKFIEECNALATKGG